jgi:hypothetical protein
MLAYALLAAIAARKRQLIGRDRFLVLAGVAATRAGWPGVAGLCQQLIAAHQPRHLVAHHASFADALRDDDFAFFVRQTERFCSLERAEHLLSTMGIPVPVPGENRTAGETAASLLAGERGT